jgi:hypothetical protein
MKFSHEFFMEFHGIFHKHLADFFYENFPRNSMGNSMENSMEFHGHGKFHEFTERFSPGKSYFTVSEIMIGRGTYATHSSSSTFQTQMPVTVTLPPAPHLPHTCPTPSPHLPHTCPTPAPNLPYTVVLPFVRKCTIL